MMQEVIPGIPCQTRSCPVNFGPDVELYNFQDALFFNENALSFIVNCPAGYNCPPGTFPKVVTYPRGTFVIPDPGTNDGFPIVLSLQGCQSVVSRWLPAGSSSAVIANAAQEIINEVAQQQAECDSVVGLNPNPVFFNQEVYAAVDCPAGNELEYTGTPPPYFTVYSDLNRVVMDSGIVGGSTQEEANQIAQGFLDQWTDTEFTAGRLECVTCNITTTSPLTSGNVNTAYSETLTVTGLSGTPTWSVTAGTLPDGLSINSSTGEISGSPTTEETKDFTIQVTNGSRTCRKDFELTIDPEAVCVDWNILAWDPASIFNGTFSPDNTTGPAWISHTNGGVGVASNTALIDYNGPGCNCQADINVSGDSLPNDATCKFSFASVAPFVVYSCFASAGTAPGNYIVSFSFPDTAGMTITFRITIAFQSTGGSAPTTFTGTLSNV